MPVLSQSQVKELATKAGQPMEHQKKKAMKILEQAEELFKRDDVHGALSLALQAHRVFPSLHGLGSVLIAYRIHVAVREEKLPSGDTNWYPVLGAEPSSNLEVIKNRHYFLLLHTNPIKCKSSAAEGAFKLVEQAWNYINSSSSPTSGSTSSPAPQNTAYRPRLLPPPAASDAANLKPATRTSDGKLVCPCQAEFGGMIADDGSRLCKCQSNPKDEFADPTPCRQPENDSRHARTFPPPPPSPTPKPGIAQAHTFTQHSSSLSGIPNFLLCPFCGTRNGYEVIDGLCHITCKQCCLSSSIGKNIASSNRSNQTGGALPSSSHTGIAMCRKCRTPYDGGIPNGRRILLRCKPCGSWASIKLDIKQISVYDDQKLPPTADPPDRTAPVAPDGGN